MHDVVAKTPLIFKVLVFDLETAAVLVMVGGAHAHDVPASGNRITGPDPESDRGVLRLHHGHHAVFGVDRLRVLDVDERGEDGPGEVSLSGALEDQKFADEIVQHGQSDAGQRRNKEDRRNPGRGCRDATVIRDGKRVTPLIHKAHEDEEGSR